MVYDGIFVDAIHADRTKQQRDNTARGSVDGGQNAVYQYSHDSHRQNDLHAKYIHCIGQIMQCQNGAALR